MNQRHLRIILINLHFFLDNQFRRSIIDLASMNTKKRQPKTNGTKTRVVHVAIPIPTFNKIRKIAKAEDRSINWKLNTVIQQAFAD